MILLPFPWLAPGLVHTVGWIVLGAGVLGLVVSMIFWSSWGGPAYFAGRRTVVEEAPRPGY